MIDNCEKDNVRQCSVDLRIKKIFRIKSSKVALTFSKNDVSVEELKLPYILRPGEYILASTIEKINQKNTKFSNLIISRSRTFRMGLSIESGIASPQYKGEIIFGIRNISENKIKLQEKDSLVQAVFFEVESDIIPLDFTYMNGKVV
jgi:deoxycytidine triphosphate deaminase